MNRSTFALLLLMILGACARPGGEPQPPAPSNEDGAEPETAEEDEPPPPPRASDPLVEPRIAMLAGLMPLGSTGADVFVERNPTYDGRGVLIGILDSGLDLGLPGFRQTTTGEPKVLDVRDFSGEGRIALERVDMSGDTVTFNGQTFVGFGRVQGYASPPYYAGVFHELPLGDVPAGDVNGNDTNMDAFVVFVARTASGWAVVTDTDNDERLDDELPKHDFTVAQETFTYGLKDGEHDRGFMTIAVDFTESSGEPILDLFFDNSAHGSHVAGIAAGHNMFGVEGFNGVAPGAQLLAVKISNNARGGISVTGSMVRAMNYATDFARQRGRPLILNLSFGVGNEVEGHAAIDSIVNEFALRNPNVLFVISAGNEGPGISTVGFPGSADHILSACALIPGAFSGPRPAGLATDSDVIADFSSRGGELGKPDLCAPGVAFSNVPRWNLGNEVSGGTSMAAPQLTGAAALLQSAQVQQNRTARAVDLRHALMASAERSRAGTAVDIGAGVPKVPRAHEWLNAGHQAGMYLIRSLPDGGNTSLADGAYRRSGLASPEDTIQRFEVRSVAGQPAARFRLRSDQRWLRAPELLELSGEPTTVTLRYDARRLRTPGLYVGTVSGTPASDTLAGAAFRLVSTIVVPQRLTQPFVEGRDLGPGRIQRYFFDVPPDAGGLVVEMETKYQPQTGSLYLLEPSGQPFRGGGTLEASRGKPKVRAVVNGEDLIPGVYEAVVVAPASSALSYDIRAALPRYTVDEIGAGPSAVVRKRADVPDLIQDAAVFQRERADSSADSTDDVEITARIVGAARTYEVRGQNSEPRIVSVTSPEWARELVLDVKLPDGDWNGYTDFGVTVFDSVGRQVGQGPLTFGFGRAEVELARRHRGKRLDIELFPAYAHVDPPPEWSAEVTVTFIDRNPPELELAGSDSTNLVLEAGESTRLEFGPSDEVRALPEGFVQIVEVVATPAAGAPAGRRGRMN